MGTTELITLGISFISIVICIITFIKNGQKDVKTETTTESYRQGQLDMKLKHIMEKLDKIEAKLDSYDNEMDDKIEKAINLHLQLYHGKGD